MDLQILRRGKQGLGRNFAVAQVSVQRKEALLARKSRSEEHMLLK